VESYDGPATIEQGEHEVTVTCAFWSSVESRSGIMSWGGTFSHPDSAHVLDAGNASLILPMGERGAVILNHVTYAATGSSGTFVGTGPPPSPAANF
jgi:hypothetical protein